MRVKVLCCLLVLGMAASTARATDGTLNWAYQATGFQAGTGSNCPQTALAMRDGDTWPVIFSTSYQYPNYGVQAYSLYPVSNPATQTNWFQIGTNVLLYYNYGNGILSAATSSDGRIGAVVRDPGNPNSNMNMAVVGGSAGGFGTQISGVRAIDFTAQGTLVTGTMNTVPSGAPLADIAVSPNGDLAAVDECGTYYQKSSLIGGWAAQNLGLPPTPFADLAVDGLGRPHVVSTPASGGLGSLVTSDFDVMTGQWTHQTLSSNAMVLEATVAADGLGGVGAAWVQKNASTGGFTLEYAYNDGIDGWAVQPVTSSVFNPQEFNYDDVSPQERVGLAFDANNFPVISFVAGPNNIWLAYDPPITVPEPSTLALLAAGAIGLLAYVWRKRK